MSGPSFLHTLVNKNKSLSETLHKAMGGYDEPRSRAIIHASALTKEEEYCPRYHAIMDRLDKEHPKEFVTTSQRMTFDFGRLAQDIIVNYLADEGKMVGDWSCAGCRKFYSLQNRPESCKCGCKKFDYHEHRFTSRVSGASCGVDILFSCGVKLKVTEVKTMKLDDFKNLKAPLAEHRIRTAMYLKIIAESDDPFAEMIDTESAKILYTVKEGWGRQTDPFKDAHTKEKFSPFLEFDVSRDDKTSDVYLGKAKALSDWRQNPKQELPARICPNVGCKRAKYCPVMGECFGGK